MRLDPGERSILATFGQYPRAVAAREALLGAGFRTVQVDRIGAGGYDPEPDRARLRTGETPTQGVVWQDETGKLPGDDVRPLVAAMPEVSGMAGPLVAGGHGVLLTAVVPEERLEEALDIIRRLGGRC
ncbi:hypothetical protein [Caldinitratiruptor microaerophilus]|uniref:Uncharacterized protein n=1 Tax=Caldinitratiruptor microaerophilus TaxID=671077 RepID=A0AA35CIS3_9FIRM|nr:hypothetical protein [Caldinitratiruptor microaerophilus]BDG59984.1 hypothetical protein caldi_10740 [Caldinitratiruptor microaerophilus]